MTNRDVMGKKCFGDLQNNHDSEHLSLDLCGLTVPWPGHCESRCNEHRGICVFTKKCF